MKPLTRPNLIIAVSAIVTLMSCHQPLSKRELLNVYKDSLSHHIPGAKLSIKDDSTLSVEFKGKTGTHSIDNAYVQYLQTPDSIGNILHQYIETAIELYSENDLKANRTNLIATIKPVSYLDGIHEISKNADAKEGFKMAYEKYNDQLVVFFAADTKTGIAYLPEKEIAGLGIPRDSLLTTVEKNLANILPKIELRGDSGLYMITAGGNYEASLILLDFVWTKENIKVKGDFVIGIPNRDVLLVTGSEDKTNIKKIKNSVSDLFTTGSYPVSSDLFIRKNGKFIKFYE